MSRRRGLSDRALAILRADTAAEHRIAHSIGSPALFALALGAAGSTIYYALGVVAGDALGLTPVVFAAAAVFFILTLLTYVEGSSLHPERGGASTFARYAFDEFWSFIAGWAILLDHVIVMAIGAFAVSHYLAAFWSPIDDSGIELVVAAAVLGWVAWTNLRGYSGVRYRTVMRLSLISLVLFAVIVTVGLIELFDIGLLTRELELGASPQVDELVFAAVVACVACTGIEAASGLAGEVAVRGPDLRRLVRSVAIAVVVLFVGISLVAVMAVPVVDGETALGSNAVIDAPVLGVVSELEPSWLSDVLRLAVGAIGAAVLVGAVNGQMLGLGRLTYSLGRNRQIPSALARLDQRRSTPYVAIGVSAVLAFFLSIGSIEFLAGIFAFGAMLAFTLAHVSIIVLRFREPDAPRPYRMPLSVKVGRGTVPLPALAGALLGIVGWASVLALHSGARLVGGAWMVAGIVMYVIYRRGQGKSLTRRFTVPEAAMREAQELSYGSILVPVFGGELDDDIVGTAGRLASEEVEDEDGATLEAVFVFEMPMSLPIDARVPDDRVAAARTALARAKEVGEEYAGVEVATAMVRGRSVGGAIVAEAQRRGVEVIVLAARAPSRIRGGAILGGRGRGHDRFADEMTRYVVEKAPCRVVLTAPGAAG